MTDEKISNNEIEQILTEKMELENQLREKSLEAYKLKRIAEEGLEIKHIAFLRGNSEEDFEQSLNLFKEERTLMEERAKKRINAISSISEPTKTASPKKVTPEDDAKREILKLGGHKII